MALTVCQDCKSEISTDAKTCTKCGAHNAVAFKGARISGLIYLCLVGLLFYWIWGLMTPEPVNGSDAAAPEVQADQHITLINAEDYGDSWPFTLEEMHLLCLQGNAVVASDPETGQMYPLNGLASGKAMQLGLEPLVTVWRDDPSNPGAKVSIGPFVERGLELCQQ